MESRFAHLRQRDNSVSMLRVKMSRRRSQTQKENRDRVVNTRRHLSAVQELEMSSLDASIALANMSLAQEKKQQQKNVAGEERLKQLQRWKERKTLQKEKEKREKGRKGVFKTGLYHPKDSMSVEPLPPVPAAPGRAKETKAAPAQSTRVTRSMKQQPVQKPLKLLDGNTARKKCQPPPVKTTRIRGAAPKPAPSPGKTKAEPATRGSSTRSAHKPPITAHPVLKDKPREKCADARTTRSKVVPPPVEGKKSDDKTVPGLTLEDDIVKADMEQEELKACPPNPSLQSDEEMAVEQTVTDPAPTAELPNTSPKTESFAPEGFLFQAPVGLSSFKFDPLTPRSADAFLTPSSSFTLPSVPSFDDECKVEEHKPSPKSPRRSPLAPAIEIAEESNHDVPYFRSEIANETDRLTGLCVQWESKVEDEAIPEEMRDRMRTAVGQARLLMKERFNQFSGLVDNCEFGRGEKITTCTDLQGFWDMVYFQVEDVQKKFDFLKEAEARGWVEEHKPPPRQRKVAKKPAPAPAPSKPVGTKAAAKSRLAAAKAAMKARQQAAEAESTEQSSEEALQEANNTVTIVNNGGSFQAKSPAKAPDSVRRSTRLSAMALPQQSPSSNCLTPRRVTRRSLALAQTPVQNSAQGSQTTPCHSYPVTKTPAQAALSNTTPYPESVAGVSLCFSPIKEMSSNATEQTEDFFSDPGQSILSNTVEKLDKPAEDLRLDLNLSLSDSQPPCKTPVESPAPVPSTSLSFPVSSCAAQLSSPAVSCTPQADSATPDSSVNEEIPGIDFERYLQPSQRDSLSPSKAFAMESPMAMDVDMESPKGQPENPLTQQETVFCTLPSVQTPVSSLSPQTVESALFLFTPDIKDRIRQSHCPSDLMVFTPPHL